jgi:ribonuclease BN (tRNA processing enzyme)
MRLAILGSGSAVPDPVRGNPSAAVVAGEEILLFDCGERTTVNLVRAGINPVDVRHVFFTHLHWDHIADFNYLLMTVWNCGRREPLHVWGPPGTREMTEAFLAAHRVDVEFVRVFVEQLPAHIMERPAPAPVLEFHGLHDGVILDTARSPSARPRSSICASSVSRTPTGRFAWTARARRSRSAGTPSRATPWSSWPVTWTS